MIQLPNHQVFAKASFLAIPATLLAILTFSALSEGQEIENSKPVPQSKQDPLKTFAAPGSRCFEMRTYHTHAGKLDDLNRRFSDHTNALFVKHGMVLVGYWMPEDRPETLIYILAYPDRAARNKAWKGFMSDPAWKKAFADSRKGGPLVKKVDSVFLKATNYSPIQ